MKLGTEKMNKVEITAYQSLSLFNKLTTCNRSQVDGLVEFLNRLIGFQKDERHSFYPYLLSVLKTLSSALNLMLAFVNIGNIELGSPFYAENSLFTLEQSYLKPPQFLY